MPVQVIASSYNDGATLTAAATTSCLPTYVPTTLPAGYWQIGRVWRLTASGRVSFAVSTPGTFRLDLRFAAITVFDTLALAGNVVVQNTIPWYMEVIMTCRSVGTGTSATLFSQGYIDSMAFLNVAAPATGPYAGITPVPYNTAPVAGTGFDSTIANALDFRFTQTTNTGSFTLHTFLIEQLTP
jgi:hypothetical protein